MGGGGLANFFIPPELSEMIDDLKDTYPQLQKRIERIEAEIHAISYVLAKKYPELWDEGVSYAEKLVKSENKRIEEMKAKRKGKR